MSSKSKTKDVGLVATQNNVDVCSHNLSSTHKLNPLYIPYYHAGCLFLPKGQCKPIVILRLTGTTLSLLRRSAVSFDDYIETGSVQDIQDVSAEVMTVALVEIEVSLAEVKGKFIVGFADK